MHRLNKALYQLIIVRIIAVVGNNNTEVEFVLIPGAVLDTAGVTRTARHLLYEPIRVITP